MMPHCYTELGRISTPSQTLKPVSCTGATGIAAATAAAGTGGGTSGRPPPQGGRRRTSGKRRPGPTGAAARPPLAGRSQARIGTFLPRQPWSPSGRGPKASRFHPAVGASCPGNIRLAEIQHADVHRLSMRALPATVILCLASCKACDVLGVSNTAPSSLAGRAAAAHEAADVQWAQSRSLV